MTLPPRQRLWLGLGALLAGGVLAMLLQLRLATIGRLVGVDPYLVLLGASLTFLSVGSYVVWPSRWNVHAHVQVGFAIAAYLIPLFLTDTLSRFPRSEVESYALLTTAGAAAFAIGLMAARVTYTGRRATSLPRLLAPTRATDAELNTRIRYVVLAACVGLLISFVLIGFVPLVADDPLTAKLFRGAYAARYRAVAPLYRFALYALAACIPLVLVAWYSGRDRRDLLLSVFAIGLLLGGLNRDPALTGFVIFLGLVATRRAIASAGYVLFVAIAFPLIGATFFILLAHIGLDNFTGVYGLQQNASIRIWDLVEAGAPDVRDHLTFLSAFAEHGERTYGRTFVGALVPYNFVWNPGVWTIHVVFPDADVTTVVSGGLRLPVPIWGYTAFGPLGVALVPLLSGYVLGVVSAIARENIGKGSLLTSSVQLALYITVGLQLSEFYFLTVYTVPAAVALWYIAFGPPRVLSRTRVGASR